MRYAYISPKILFPKDIPGKKETNIDQFNRSALISSATQSVHLITISQNWMHGGNRTSLWKQV